MGLTDALNSRKSNQDAAVPVVTADNLMILATEPVVETPSPDTSAGAHLLRDLRPGEVGTVTESKYPDTPYDVDALASLIQRTRNGCDFMLAHLNERAGHDQIGFFIDLMEATSCMLVAHMSNHILNEEP